MRAYLDIEVRQAELFAVVTADGVPRSERPVRWAGEPGRRLLAAPSAGTVPGAAALAAAVDQGRATTQELDQYGALLFEAAFGEQAWTRLTEAAAARHLGMLGLPYLELAIRAPAQVLLTRLRATAAPHVAPPVLDDIVLFLNAARYRSRSGEIVYGDVA